MYLLYLGITHILNVSVDLPNKYTENFVYARIAIRDSIESDAFSRFDQAIAFINRVEAVQGKV